MAMELSLSPFARLLLGQGRYKSGPRDIFCPAAGWLLRVRRRCSHELFDYIKGYYNTHRKHSSLGDKAPNEFEQKSSLLNEDNTGPKISCTSHPHVCGDVAIRHSPLGSSPRVWSNGANTISRRARSANTTGVACRLVSIAVKPLFIKGFIP